MNRICIVWSTALLSTVLLSLAACGPVVIGTGVSSLGGTEVVSETIVLVVVNDSDEAVSLLLQGEDGQGVPITAQPGPLAPGATAILTLPRAEALRVRAIQQAFDLATPPVAWDFRIDQPVNRSSLRLGVEAGVLSGVMADGQASNQIAFDRLVGDESTAAFHRVAGGALTFTPDGFAVHPCGCYVYALKDLGGGSVEISTFRIDARTGQLQLVAPEFENAPANPRSLDYVGGFADLEAFVEPLGRQLYVVQRLPAQFLSVVSLLPILADGSLGEPETVLRGLIGDLAVRADGRRLYLSEDLNEGAGFVLRDFALDADGRILNAAGQTAMPCAATEAGRFVLHPSGRFLYAALEDPGFSQVNVGAYFIGDNGGILFINRDCGGFETLEDLQVDPSGGFLFATGIKGGVMRVVRYALDATSGALAATPGEQSLGSVSRLAATDDPARPASDPLRQLVYIAIDDALVPHVRQPDGTLQPVASGSSLGFGSPANTFFVRGLRRGCAVLTTL